MVVPQDIRESMSLTWPNEQLHCEQYSSYLFQLKYNTYLSTLLELMKATAVSSTVWCVNQCTCVHIFWMCIHAHGVGRRDMNAGTKNNQRMERNNDLKQI